MDVDECRGMPEYFQSKMKRLLLLAATTGYQTKIFAEAAQSLGLDLVMATDRCHVLDDPWGDHAVPVRFEEPEAAAANLAQLAPPPDAIVAIGDRPAYIGALTAQAMGLPYNSPESVAACRNKFTAREKFRAAGLPVPRFARLALNAAANPIGYPCVLKPLGLSASRGVIRADNDAEFAGAFARIRAILDQSGNPPAARRAGPVHSSGSIHRRPRVCAGGHPHQWRTDRFSQSSTSRIRWTARTSRKRSTSRRRANPKSAGSSPRPNAPFPPLG